MFVGIDPGKTGAVCKLDLDGSILEINDMPTFEDKKEKITEVKRSVSPKAKTRIKKKASAKKTKVDTYIDSTRLLELIGTNSQVIIEKVSAMPGQGVTSMFTFGKVFGAIVAIASLGGRPRFTRPMEWQKHFSVTMSKEEKEGKTKGDITKEHKLKIASKVLEIYPDAKSDLYTPRGRLLDGRADAILIARYLYEKSLDNK